MASSHHLPPRCESYGLGRSRGYQLQTESYEANQKELPEIEVDHLEKGTEVLPPFPEHVDR